MVLSLGVSLRPRSVNQPQKILHKFTEKPTKMLKMCKILFIFSPKNIKYRLKFLKNKDPANKSWDHVYFFYLIFISELYILQHDLSSEILEPKYTEISLTSKKFEELCWYSNHFRLFKAQ